MDLARTHAAIRRAVFGVGLVATGRALLRRLLQKGPTPTQAAPQQKLGHHPFDVAYGIDTGGFRSWQDLPAAEANNAFSSGYLGVAPSIARRLIGTIPDPEHYTFIDIGCGKGRALVVASERRFARLLGIELVADLADAARRNAAVIAARHKERPPIEVVRADAATFEYPPQPLVIFLYQPFEMPVMRKVVAQLQASLAAAPRPVIVLYVNPALARAFDGAAVLERAAEARLEPLPEEVPFGYAGRGGADRVLVWRTRAPRPEVSPL
jgi:SAM-dependent methyltransferase